VGKNLVDKVTPSDLSQISEKPLITTLEWSSDNLLRWVSSGIFFNEIFYGA